METAFAYDSPPPALNLVNPRHAPWAEIIAYVRRSIITQKALREDALPIVTFGEWFALLEKKAEDATEEDLVKIVSVISRLQVLEDDR